jgi:hypothetical protein
MIIILKPLECLAGLKSSLGLDYTDFLPMGFRRRKMQKAIAALK